MVWLKYPVVLTMKKEIYKFHMMGEGCMQNIFTEQYREKLDKYKYR